MCTAARTAAFVWSAWCLSVLPARGGENVGQASAERQYAVDVRPALAKYCFRCHSGDEPKGELKLDGYRDTAAVLGDRKVWLAVADRLRDGDMPPQDEPQPAADQREQIVAWLDGRFAAAERQGPRDPGRVTIRRLNRAEYNNTIRDLLGIDFKRADDFPSDDVGYGFDNIGDVLSMPPILLEKYLSAAQAIADRTIVAHPQARVIAKVDARKAERHRGGQAFSGSAWQFPSNGELHITIRPPADGKYELKVTAFGQQAGTEPARMSLRIDDKEVGLIDVDAVEAAPLPYALSTNLTAGDHRFSVAFVNDFYDPKDPNPANRDRNLVVERVEVSGPAETALADLPASHRRVIPREPAADGRQEYAREILVRLAGRAFRRPATEPEIERLLKLFETGERRDQNFADGIKLALQAILVSPHFLFRVELDPESAPAATVRSLGDYEIASRLSYFLWSSMPDDELFAAAQAGKLHEPAELASQAKRMLKDAKSRALVDNFAGQWLQLRNLKNFAPDKNLFPEFDESLRSAMREETERFFAAVVSEDRSALDFLDADFTFVNERLARHYEIADVRGDEFRRVQLAGEQRGGVLTHASVLAVTSNPTRTSPVKRGKWVLENLLGAPPPPPPPGVPELKDSAKGPADGSLRERMEQHRAKAECAVCHNRMDPIGFGLENYNAVGAWRTHDGVFAVDASGTLPGGKTFSGPMELKQILKAKQSQFIRCLAEKLLTYGLGRGLEEYDRPSVSDIVDASAAEGYRFSSLVAAVICSDPFLKRRTSGEKP